MGHGLRANCAIHFGGWLVSKCKIGTYLLDVNITKYM